MRKIIFTLIVALSAIGYVRAQEQILVDEVIAVVGSKPILLSNIEAQYLQQQAQGYRVGNQSKCELLEGMLFQKLLLAQAELDSIEVSDDEVSSNLDMRMQDYVRQAGSKDALERYFGKTMVEIKAEFAEVVKDQMVSQRMQNEITKDVNITPQEVGNFYSTIPADSLPMVEAEYEIQQITQRPPISREEKDAATKKLEQLRDRVLKGESFATLAILYSQDPGSAKNGGELGFINRTDLDPTFATAAFNLRDGQISRVIESEFGLHIIQLIDKKGDEQINVRHILIIPKINNDDKLKAKSKLDSIASQIAGGKISFEAAAMAYSDDKATSNNGGLMVNQYTGSPRFETKHIDPETNLVLQRLLKGDMSMPFEAKDERSRTLYKIIKLKNKTTPHVANIQNDYQQIQELALANRKQKVVENWVKTRSSATYVKINPEWRTCKFTMPEWLQ
ncbi:MAG: Peptidyl-prolyl cis-trans isomerase SurA [Bacteroidota bacterium]